MATEVVCKACRDVGAVLVHRAERVGIYHSHKTAALCDCTAKKIKDLKKKVEELEEEVTQWRSRVSPS
jgi:phage host-nuclease inhibitor protein Gam